MTNLKSKYPFYLANKPAESGRFIDLIDKYSGAAVAKVGIADAKIIDQGIEAAVKAAPALASMASYERQLILQHCVDLELYQCH